MLNDLNNNDTINCIQITFIKFDGKMMTNKSVKIYLHDKFLLKENAFSRGNELFNSDSNMT